MLVQKLIASINVIMKYLRNQLTAEYNFNNSNYALGVGGGE